MQTSHPTISWLLPFDWVPITITDYNGPVRPQNLWHHDQVNDAFSIIWDHTFSPTL